MISIITPAYNAARLIGETIASVQAQTWPHWEMIVVDDGSTDGTADAVGELAAGDDRIKCIRQENGRQGKARNTALRHARFPYVAFLDADDLWHPEKLEKQMAVLQSTGADLVHSQGWVFQGNMDNRVRKITCEPGFAEPGTMLRKALNGYCVHTLSVVVRREWIDRVGGFDEDLRLQNAEDYQLFLKLADAGARFYGMQDELILYRMHEGQVTAADSNATLQALWALYLADLKNISEENRLRLVTNRLNRYLLHNLAEHSRQRMGEILRFYRHPLQQYGKWLLLKLLASAGKKALQKAGYRILDLRLLDEAAEALPVTFNPSA